MLETITITATITVETETYRDVELLASAIHEDLEGDLGATDGVVHVHIDEVIGVPDE